MEVKKTIPTKAEFAKWSRSQKRSLIVTVAGKKMKIMDYISIVAKDLPVCRDKNTKKVVDHKSVLKDLYMKEGLAGIEEYRSMIADTFVNQLKAQETDGQKEDDSN